jgi:hypothetical protein
LYDIDISTTTFANCAGFFTTFAKDCFGVQAAKRIFANSTETLRNFYIQADNKTADTEAGY